MYAIESLDSVSILILILTGITIVLGLLLALNIKDEDGIDISDFLGSFYYFFGDKNLTDRGKVWRKLFLVSLIILVSLLIYNGGLSGEKL